MDKEKYNVLNKRALVKVIDTDLSAASIGKHLKGHVDDEEAVKDTKKKVAKVCREIADDLDPQQENKQATAA